MLVNWCGVRPGDGTRKTIYREPTLPSKVMVVEDELILAQNLKEYLGARDLEVQLAHDGASAIELAAQFKPDLVVLDFRLPDMEGFQVFDAIRQYSDCCCVLITGHPSSQVFDGAKRRGIWHILFKPFPLAELARAVHEQLAQRQATTHFVERRRHQPARFPMRLYDGTWLSSDRRKASTVADDNEEQATEVDPSTGP